MFNSLCFIILWFADIGIVCLYNALYMYYLRDYISVDVKWCECSVLVFLKQELGDLSLQCLKQACKFEAHQAECSSPPAMFGSLQEAWRTFSLCCIIGNAQTSPEKAMIVGSWAVFGGSQIVQIWPKANWHLSVDILMSTYILLLP